MGDGGVAVAKCLETRAARFVTEAIERSIRVAEEDKVGEEEEGERVCEERGEGGACLVGGATVTDVRRGTGEQRVRASLGQAVGSSGRVNGAAVWIPRARMLESLGIEEEDRASDAEPLWIRSIGRRELGEANSGFLP